MSDQIISLPKPQSSSQTSVEEAIKNRRSIRRYKEEHLKLSQVSQLLWAAYGMMDSGSLRTAPSAGAKYPLEFYVVANNIEGLSAGVYKYNSKKHELNKIQDKDIQEELCEASYKQPCVKNAAAIFVISAVYDRTVNKYGEAGKKYVHMDVGHAAQNMYLQCESLGLGMVVAAGFEESKVKKVMGIPADETTLYLVSVGKI